MSTRSSLRRSRRKVINSDYKVGDVVRIVRNGTTVPAQLAQLLTEGTSSPHPRWLVEMEVPPFKDEVYEHQFCKRGSPSSSTVSPGEGGESRTNSPLQPIETPGEPQTHPTLSTVDLPVGPPPKKIAGDTVLSAHKDKPGESHDHASQKKSVSFGQSEAGLENASTSNVVNSGTVHVSAPTATRPAPTRTSSNSRRSSKISAREARSRRRQQMIDERGQHTVSTALLPPPRSTKRKISGAAAAAVQNKHRKRALAAAAAAAGVQSPHPYSASQTSAYLQRNKGNLMVAGDAPVTKVKFLTGTLLIHRGRRRRVEFVRRV